MYIYGGQSSHIFTSIDVPTQNNDHALITSGAHEVYKCSQPNAGH